MKDPGCVRAEKKSGTKMVKEESVWRVSERGERVAANEGGGR
jgi:hypothetical protein